MCRDDSLKEDGEVLEFLKRSRMSMNPGISENQDDCSKSEPANRTCCGPRQDSTDGNMAMDNPPRKRRAHEGSSILGLSDSSKEHVLVESAGCKNIKIDSFIPCFCNPIFGTAVCIGDQHALSKHPRKSSEVSPNHDSWPDASVERPIPFRGSVLCFNGLKKIVTRICSTSFRDHPPTHPLIRQML